MNECRKSTRREGTDHANVAHRRLPRKIRKNAKAAIVISSTILQKFRECQFAYSTIKIGSSCRLPASSESPERFEPRKYHRDKSSSRAQRVGVTAREEKPVCCHRGQPLPDEAARDEFFAQVHDQHTSVEPSMHQHHRADRERGGHGIIEGHIEDEEANIDENPQITAMIRPPRAGGEPCRTAVAGQRLIAIPASPAKNKR
jgi:hypothetical protein